MKDEQTIANTMAAFNITRSEAETVEYIGDSVYVSYDGYQVWLYTYNGLSVSDKIALEPPVMRSLIDYAQARQAVSV
jgi:hypothetical protein